MGLLRICSLSVWLSTILFTHTLAQYIAPSNNSSDLYPIATSPRFLLKNSVNPEFGSLPVIRLAPLKPYAQDITKGDFLSVDQPGQLVNIDASNVNELQPNQFGYLSCDPGAYSGYLNASGVFDIAFNSGSAFIIILYSETHNHCSLNGITDPSLVNAVLTTVDPSVASMLANLHLNSNSKGNCAILPDLNSYTNGSSSSGWDGSSILGPSPTTAVAMIILYSITGIITALFVIIIVTGAIRAHRHPERYGPRNFTGRGRQSRAKGIARAMLETLPIVKFGDHTDLPTKPAEGADIEMNAADTSRDATSATEADGSEAAGAATRDKDSASTSDSEKAAAGAAHLRNADGTQADGSLACSICTEEFTKGEEVRVLPCNHKFHPECVDPWLLNVSGTCPLCRIDLRPKGEAAKEAEGTADTEAATGVDGERGADAAVLPPPLEGTAGPSAASGVRRDTITNLRGFATGTGEERIAALRRLREERRRRGVSNAEGEVERRGVRDRLTTRFRIRTLRGGATDETLGTGSTS